MSDRILQPTKDIILLLHSKMNFTKKNWGNTLEGGKTIF